MSSYSFLNWLDFELAIKTLYDKYKNNTYNGIYGVPRGGLVLAIKLSHLLNIPLLTKPDKKGLWIDDIIDSGKTFEKYKNSSKDYCCWIARKNNNLYYNIDINQNWIVFPWESDKKKQILKDKELYVNRFN